MPTCGYMPPFQAAAGRQTATGMLADSLRHAGRQVQVGRHVVASSRKQEAARTAGREPQVAVGRQAVAGSRRPSGSCRQAAAWSRMQAGNRRHAVVGRPWKESVGRLRGSCGKSVAGRQSLFSSSL